MHYAALLSCRQGSRKLFPDERHDLWQQRLCFIAQQLDTGLQLAQIGKADEFIGDELIASLVSELFEPQQVLVLDLRDTAQRGLES